MPIPIAPIIQGAIGLGESVIGLINQGKGRKEAERIQRERPQYNISPTVGQDLSLAESELANNGSAAERAYASLNNGQFSNAIDATLKSGGSPNSIGAIYGSSEDGRLRLAMMKDNLRLQQIQNLARASQRMQDEQQTQWQVNELAPWQDRAQANAAARTGAAGQTNQGINTLGSAAMNFAQGIQENNMFNPRSVNNNIGFNGNYATGVPTENLAGNPTAGGLVPQQQYSFNPYG